MLNEKAPTASDVEVQALLRDVRNLNPSDHVVWQWIERAVVQLWKTEALHSELATLRAAHAPLPCGHPAWALWTIRECQNTAADRCGYCDLNDEVGHGDAFQAAVGALLRGEKPEPIEVHHGGELIDALRARLTRPQGRGS